LAARIALLTLPALALAACAGDEPDSTLTRRVDAVFAPLVEAHEFSGAVVLLRGGEVVYQRGFGSANHDARIPFTPESPGDGGSLAKTLTAAGIWWLAQEGRIKLDAPATDYVAGYPHPGTTVRQLIAHSNGLPWDYAAFDQHFAPDQPRTTESMLEIVARHFPQPRFQPGTRFEYSSFGYDVAALAIEKASGQSYEEFLDERFFAKLGMEQSFVRPGRFADWPGARTLGYRWRDGAWVPFDVFDMEAFRGGSNIYFSAADLGRWGAANAAGTALPAAVYEAGQRRTEVAGQPTGLTGLNWYCDEAQLRCYYTGDLNAFYSFVYWDRVRNESVAFVSNSTLPAWRRPALARGLVDALAEQPARANVRAQFERFSPDTQSAIAGTYAAAGFGPAVLSKGAEGMRLRIGDDVEYDMFLVAADTFYVPGLDYWLAFTGTPPTAMHLSSMFVDTVLQRQPDRDAGKP
jgi:CubicO group peptidase (beta-lactamase class C family)